MSETPSHPGILLNSLLEKARLEALDSALSERFEDYLALLVRWNSRINLTAIRDEKGIIARHFVESIACARALPIGTATLLDFGSGAGFPGIPIALCRPEIAVTLAESQGKKAAFLSEAVRVLGISATVHSGRAEGIGSEFDCVTLRAVDKMELAVEAASKLVRPGGSLAMMTTTVDLPALQEAAGVEFKWTKSLSLPGGENRLIALGERAIGSPARQGQSCE